MNAKTEALKSFYRFLDEHGPVNFPCGDDPKPDDDSAGKGEETKESGDPESSKDTGASEDGGGEDEKSKAKLEKAVGESKKRLERAQRAEKERDEWQSKAEGFEEKFKGIKKQFDPESGETEGEEDKDKKIKELEAEKEDVRKELSIRSEFKLHALNKGMSNDTIGLIIKNLGYGDDVEYDPKTGNVEGMVEFVEEMKTKLPNLFQSNPPDDKGESGNPRKGGDDTPAPKAAEFIADRTGFTVEEVLEQDKKKVEAMKKAKKEPGEMLERWGIPKHRLITE